MNKCTLAILPQSRHPISGRPFSMAFSPEHWSLDASNQRSNDETSERSVGDSPPRSAFVCPS
jgi:hypothetical protein